MLGRLVRKYQKARSEVDHAKIADGAAFGSWISLIFAHIVELNQVLQFVAFIVAIISGLAAAYYHIKKAREL